MSKLIAVILSSLLVSQAWAASPENTNAKVDQQGPGTTCFPKTDIRRPAIPGFTLNGMTKVRFNAILDKVQRVYGPIFRSQGLRLKIKRKWSNATINASANRGLFFHHNRYLNMYGGLDRHSRRLCPGRLP